jgi:hypothetical protein
MQTCFYLSLIETTMPGVCYDSPSLDELMGIASLPQTVDQAVEKIISELSLRDKASIAKIKEEELESLQSTLGHYIRNAFRLWSGNLSLKESCRSVSGENELDEDDASAVIIRAVWNQLRETCGIRVVK